MRRTAKRTAKRSLRGGGPGLTSRSVPSEIGRRAAEKTIARRRDRVDKATRSRQKLLQEAEDRDNTLVRIQELGASAPLRDDPATQEAINRLAEKTQAEAQELRKKALDIQVSLAIGPQNLSEKIMTTASDAMGLGRDIASVSGEVLMKQIAENFQNGKEMMKQAFAERAHPYTQGMVKQAAVLYGMIVEINKMIESSRGRGEVLLLEDRDPS